MQEHPDVLHGTETVFPGGSRVPAVTTISNSNDVDVKEEDASLLLPPGNPNITVVHSATDLILAAIGGADHIELRSHALFTSTQALSEELSHASAQGIDFSIPSTVKSIRVRSPSSALCSQNFECTSPPFQNNR